MGWLDNLKAKAREMKLEVYALLLAYRDPRTPWLARIVAACVVAYAFSPIDLIPDPIPVLGYLDDLILIPLGVMLARRMVPHEVMDDCRARAREVAVRGKKPNWIAAGVIVLVWVGLSALVVAWLMRVFAGLD